MKHTATMALTLALAIPSIYAQDFPVSMTFSGTGGASSIDLKVPNTSTTEENMAGQGTLGTFTYRDIRAAALAPQASSACQGTYFPNISGGGVLGFADGSLLMFSIVAGGDCIDFVKMVAHCTLTLKITGGAGRFENASGTLTYTETALPALADYSNSLVLFSETGTITGTVSGVTRSVQR